MGMDPRIQDNREFARKKRRGRLIVRNLPFKIDEEAIKKSFGQFGELTDINIPVGKDGKPRGFAFICYPTRNQACKAVKEMNGKGFRGRVIAVDHSVPKKMYVNTESQSKEDNDKSDEIEGQIVNKLVDKMIENERRINPESIKIKNDGHDSDGNHKPNKIDMESEQMIDESTKSENKNSLDSESNLSGDDDDNLSQTTSQGSRKARKRKSRDAREGKTIFVKSLSFDTNEDALKEFFQNFGPIEYCLICRDPEFGYPKGTAFVKYKSKEDIERCLNEFETNPDKFCLDDRSFEVCLALTRGAAHQLQEKRRLKPRDKRNIYLAKEGLIYPDSPAAEGMSQADLSKRLQLEMRKRALLNNLLNFVSRNRLCVHNLPENVDDRKLKNIFLNSVNNPMAKITEAKVIRNVKGKGQTKLGKSSGFGFVTFTRHCDALKALRQLNNNPEIFKESRRPIVEFSIEKITAVKKKRKNNDMHYEEDTSTAEDLEDDVDLPYMGVKAAPFKEHEAIVLPKVNRKMYDNFEKLKERGKRLKREKNEKKINQAKMIGRIKRTREKLRIKKAKIKDKKQK